MRTFSFEEIHDIKNPPRRQVPFGAPRFAARQMAAEPFKQALIAERASARMPTANLTAGGTPPTRISRYLVVVFTIRRTRFRGGLRNE
jgi:hypothetical protein